MELAGAQLLQLLSPRSSADIKGGACSGLIRVRGNFATFAENA